MPTNPAHANIQRILIANDLFLQKINIIASQPAQRRALSTRLFIEFAFDLWQKTALRQAKVKLWRGHLKSITGCSTAALNYAFRAADTELLSRAAQDNRLFVTRDKDFGGLVFVGHLGEGVEITFTALHQPRNGICAITAGECMQSRPRPIGADLELGAHRHLRRPTDHARTLTGPFVLRALVATQYLHC